MKKFSEIINIKEQTQGDEVLTDKVNDVIKSLSKAVEATSKLDLLLVSELAPKIDDLNESLSSPSAAMDPKIRDEVDSLMELTMGAESSVNKNVDSVKKSINQLMGYLKDLRDTSRGVEGDETTNASNEFSDDGANDEEF